MINECTFEEALQLIKPIEQLGTPVDKEAHRQSAASLIHYICERIKEASSERNNVVVSWPMSGIGNGYTDKDHYKFWRFWPVTPKNPWVFRIMEVLKAEGYVVHCHIFSDGYNYYYNLTISW